MTMTPDDRPPLLARAERLKTWIRQHMKGGCRLLSEGKRCECPLCNVDALVAAVGDLQRELEQWRTWGIIEIAVRNPNVSSYVEHWEKRAEVAEAQLQALRQTLNDLLARISNGQRQSIGSIDNVRAVQFRVDEIERLLATLTQPGAASSSCCYPWDGIHAVDCEQGDDRTADELTAARAHPHCPECRCVLEGCRCKTQPGTAGQE